MLAVRLERIIVAAVEEINKAGDAGFGVDGEVDDTFLGLLASNVCQYGGRILVGQNGLCKPSFHWYT